MPGLVDHLVPAKLPLVAANHLAVQHHDDPVGVGPHRDRFADRHGINAVAVAVEVDQQLRGDPDNAFLVAVER